MGQAGKHTHSPRDPTSSQWPIMDTRGRSWPIRGPAAALCRLLPESLRSGIAPSRAHSTSSTERGPQHPSPAAGTLADRPTMAPFHLQDFPSSQDDGIRAWPPGLTLHLPRGQVTFQLVGPRGRGRQRSPGWSSSSPGCARFPHCPPPPSTAPPTPNPSGFLTRPQTRRLLAIWALSHFSSGRCEPGSAKGPSLRVSLEAGGHEKD